jgi:isopenicillin N synthase-like dioxygenase
MNPFTRRSNVSPLHLRQLDFTKTSNFKGYNAVLSSNNNPNGAGDMHEGFEFGWEVIDDAPGSLAANHLNDGSMAGANVWPDVPGFREALLQY